MKRYRVIVSSEAQRDPFVQYEWIENLADKRRAKSYLQRLKRFTQLLETAPERGRQWNEVRSGMWVTGFENRVKIVRAVVDKHFLFSNISGLEEAGRKNLRHPTNPETTKCDDI
jgi:plasmid stabilization system protein ParE